MALAAPLSSRKGAAREQQITLFRAPAVDLGLPATNVEIAIRLAEAQLVFAGLAVASVMILFGAIEQGPIWAAARPDGWWQPIRAKVQPATPGPVIGDPERSL